MSRRGDEEEEEEDPIKLLAMEIALAIIRSSINAFFNGYSTFTSIATLLLLPSSVSVLLPQALVSSPTAAPTTMLDTLSPLLRAAASAGFPPSPRLDRPASFFPLLFPLPFVLTFSLLAKSCVALVIRDGGARRPRRRGLPSLSSLLEPYSSVLPTHLLGALLAITADSSALALSLLVSLAADSLDLSARRLPCSLFLAILRSVAAANVTAVRSVAVAAAAMENRGGCSALLRACSLVGGRLRTALWLVVPANLGMAAVEALFEVRVVREYRSTGMMSCCLLWEAFSIAYLHAILMVLDVIMACVFYEKCCQTNIYSNNCGNENDDREEEEEEEEEEIKGKKVYFEL